METTMNFFTDIWQDERHPPRKEIVARLLLSALAMVTASFSVTAPNTFVYKMVVAGGLPALLSVIAMGVTGCLLMADTIINEMLPQRYSFPWARSYRQGMWMALGCVQMLFAYLVFTNSLSVSLGAYLILYGLGSFTLAFVDAAAEKMHRQCNA